MNTVDAILKARALLDGVDPVKPIGEQFTSLIQEIAKAAVTVDDIVMKAIVEEAYSLMQRNDLASNSNFVQRLARTRILPLLVEQAEEASGEGMLEHRYSREMSADILDDLRKLNGKADPVWLIIAQQPNGAVMTIAFYDEVDAAESAKAIGAQFVFELPIAPRGTRLQPTPPKTSLYIPKPGELPSLKL